MARHEVHMEKYCKVVGIEAATLVDMVQHSILGAASAYAGKLLSLIHIFSSVRMLRPSRPMMRPFISSLGSATTETVVSAA